MIMQNYDNYDNAEKENRLLHCVMKRKAACTAKRNRNAKIMMQNRKFHSKIVALLICICVFVCLCICVCKSAMISTAARVDEQFQKLWHCFGQLPLLHYFTVIIITIIMMIIIITIINIIINIIVANIALNSKVLAKTSKTLALPRKGLTS